MGACNQCQTDIETADFLCAQPPVSDRRERTRNSLDQYERNMHVVLKVQGHIRGFIVRLRLKRYIGLIEIEQQREAVGLSSDRK